MERWMASAMGRSVIFGRRGTLERSARELRKKSTSSFASSDFSTFLFFSIHSYKSDRSLSRYHPTFSN